MLSKLNELTFIKKLQNFMTNNVIWAKIKTPTCRQVQTQNYVTNSQTLMQSAMSDNCGILTYKSQ